MNQWDGVHHDIERHIRIEVPNFNGEHNIDVFLDWKHHIKAYFGWYDMPKERKLQLAEAKLTRTARI